MHWLDVSSWFEGLRHASPALILGLLAAVAFLETSTLGGLLVPGEVALIVGGALAHEDAVHVAAVVVTVFTAAIVGDLVGYSLGGRVALHLPGSRLERFVGARRVATAHDYLELHGPRALVLGRFVGITRSVLPTIAGGTGLRFRRFLAWDIAGVALYSAVAVGAGYLAGASWDRVASTISQWTPAVIAGGALIAIAVRVHHRTRPHPDGEHPAEPTATEAPSPASAQPCGLR